MFVTFAALLSGGLLLVLAMGRLRDVAWAYVRLVGILALSLAVVTAAWQFTHSFMAARSGSVASTWLLLGCGVGAAGVTVLAVMTGAWPNAIRTAAVIGGMCGVAAGVLGAGPAFTGEPASGAALLSQTGASVGAWLAWSVARSSEAMLLGSVTAAWLLGHAYLTATRMTIHPLRRFGWILAGSMGARLFLAVGTGVWVVWRLPWSDVSSGDVAAMSTVTGLVGAFWIPLCLRFIVGLAAAGVMTAMVLDCIRLRSTQSATGLLYFASVLIYLGELSAQHLALQTGWCF